MTFPDTNPHMLTQLDIEVTYQDLLQQMKPSSCQPEIVTMAKETLDKVKNIWKPAAVYNWFEFQQMDTDTLGCIFQNTGSLCLINFGYAIKFLKHATHALISVYTAGHELAREAVKASARGDLLEAYFLDIIGLIVLDRTGQAVKAIAEDQARGSGWGVGPFLSPGSVHGWDLEEQTSLCSLLPLERINVQIQDGILSPFKTVSCLIGMGPGYESDQVGSTCQVCSNRHDCQIKQAQTC
ncbi:hypothetical protein [Desulfobacula sp.]|uniref:hypothetical protein n=1 Tax=Desulfobacula sp. TaxID=2593537 RepID=UPI002609FACC|nr:hypothetical protein [Desulfobacula sp.]